MSRWIRVMFALTVLTVTNVETPTYADDTHTLSETDRLATLCKVWGFVKYYHPELASGEIDWDMTLREAIAPVRDASDRESFNDAILKLIQKLAAPEASSSWLESTTVDERVNLDLSWLGRSDVFTDVVRSRLIAIRDARRIKPSHWVAPAEYIKNATFEHEKPYANLELPDEVHRLLALFRYWNAVEYFDPYKCVIGREWDDILIEFIPRFREAETALRYQLTVLELTTRLNDAHASAMSPVLDDHFGTGWLPVTLQSLRGEIVVSRVLTSLDASCALQAGDVLVQIDGQNVKELRKQFRKYAAGSNPPRKQYLVNRYLLRGNDKATIVVRRDGGTKQVVVNRFPKGDYLPALLTKPGPAWKIIEGNIGYVDMAIFKFGHSEPAMKDLRQTRGIIFDVRTYPEPVLFELLPHLSPQAKAFAKPTVPDFLRPGVFTTSLSMEVGPKEDNPDFYPGRVVLLVDESTISRAEFVCMALQTAPAVTVIGSQTAGADGDVSYLVLPGGIKTTFSGLGVFYPDGRRTQRIGIVPDILIRPTVASLRRGEDAVLSRAVRFLKDDQ